MTVYIDVWFIVIDIIKILKIGDVHIKNHSALI